jgi:regulator of sigma E protease
MINAILTLAATGVMLGVLIFVHELGHFLAAKRAGVKVEVFSLGFGPRLVGVRRGETDYALSAIPFGGYVKMAGADPDQEITGSGREFLSKNRATRAGIVVAGPAMNFLLAVVVYTLLTFFIGVDTVTTRLVGEVAEDSPAWKAGLRAGDTVLAVAGDSVRTWDEVVSAIRAQLGKRVDVAFERGGEIGVAAVDLAGLADPYEVGMAAFSEAVIDNAKIGGPAYEAGLRSGDKIVGIGGVPVRGINEVRKVVLDAAGKDLGVEWMRDGTLLSSTVRPKDYNGVGMIEVDFRLEKRRVSLPAAFVGGLKYAAWASQQFFVFLHHLATFKVSRDMVGGPVKIGMLAGEAIRWGAVFFLNLVVYFSAQLSLINLLPIPVLDGGQLFLLGVEAVSRRSISMKERMIAQQIGFAVLLFAMLALTFNDVSSFFRK